MATISLTYSIGVLYPNRATFKDYVAAEALVAGNALYVTSAGTAGKADANAADKYQFRGLAMDSAASGEVVTAIEDGEVTGFSLGGVDVDGMIYLSDTAGAIADAAGSTTVVVGRVSKTAGKNTERTLRVFTQWEADWS